MTSTYLHYMYIALVNIIPPSSPGQPQDISPFLLRCHQFCQVNRALPSLEPALVEVGFDIALLEARD